MGYLNSIKNAIGQDLTIKVVEDGEVNEWGDPVNETVTEEAVCGVVEPDNREVEEGVEGDFENKSLRAFFDSNDSNIVEGNVIVYDGKDYRIDEVNKYTLPGRGGHYEVRASQV